MKLPQSVIDEAERQFGLQIMTFDQLPPPESMHTETQHHHFGVVIDEFERRLLSDDEFLAVRDWLESQGFDATRRLVTLGSGTEHVLTAPLQRVSLSVAYHATRTASVASILSTGLRLGTREWSTSSPNDRIDQIGNVYLSERLGNPGDEANKLGQTAHWWREHKSVRNCVNDPDWSILRIDLTGIANLRLYRDPWSNKGLVLRTEIPGSRIEQVEW